MPAAHSLGTREISRERWGTLGFLFASAAICVVGGAVRLLPDSLHGLWLDESTSLTSALEPRPDQVMISAVLHESHPPLYNILLWAWIHLFPTVEGARLLSVLAGTAAVALGMLLAASFWGRRAALIAGALGVLSPWHSYYSGEMRMYALESALGLLTVYVASRVIRRGTQSDWAFYSIGALAFAWSEFYAVFALAGLAVWTLLRARVAAGQVRRWTAAHIAIGIGLLPLLPLMVGSLIRGAGSGDRSGVLRFATLLADFGAGFVAPGWIQVAGAACALAVIAILALRMRSDAGLSLLAVYLFTPIAAVFAAGLISPVWVERSLLFVVPALWVAAAGITVKGAGSASALVAPVAAVATLALGLVELVALQAQLTDAQQRYQRLPSERAYEFVASQESNGDRFLHADIATAAPLIARDRLAGRRPLQWLALDQKRPQVDALVHSGTPGPLVNYVVGLQGRLTWDPGPTRVTYSEIKRWSDESPGFWLVVLERSSMTMGVPTQRIDDRLRGVGAGDADYTLVADSIPSNYREDERVEIDGTLFIHFVRTGV